ncbi:flagellar basal-body rod protein FlgG [Salsuginibacillus halophilus]|uniref:Flagellar basal-body rod protein FlgG n=1 Tax=Salsuginibacillus halophilus TaxID=517424 RepID=A0A2P8HHS4_9BACI|nr:flagellar hook-basal body protein [Salsuginibacillus halophilus]PSL45757.1 flagellar basal-body rod protein FlgG [Salsuginibacillus halophilus]
MYSSMVPPSTMMGQLQEKIDTVSNNMANMDQTGFRRRESSFSDLLFQQIDNQQYGPAEDGGRLTPEGLRRGSGAAVAQTALRMDQGELQSTGRNLDFAITQPGYLFEVETEVEAGETEIAYTRDGSFHLSEDQLDDGWNIVTSTGDFVLDADGDRIVVPGDTQTVNLAPDGTLQAVYDDDDEETEDIAELELTYANRPQVLEAIGNNNFQLPDLEELGLEGEEILEEPVAATDDLVMQQGLEGSNVDMGSEMTELMNAQRLYSMNARAMQNSDQMMQLINNVR